LPKKLIEARARSVILVAVAQVFAELAGGVALRLEQLADGSSLPAGRRWRGHAHLREAGAEIRILAGDEAGAAGVQLCSR